MARSAGGAQDELIDGEAQSTRLMREPLRDISGHIQRDRHASPL